MKVTVLRCPLTLSGSVHSLSPLTTQAKRSTQGTHVAHGGPQCSKLQQDNWEALRTARLNKGHPTKFEFQIKKTKTYFLVECILCNIWDILPQQIINCLTEIIILLAILYFHLLSLATRGAPFKTCDCEFFHKGPRLVSLCTVSPLGTVAFPLLDVAALSQKKTWEQWQELLCLPRTTSTLLHVESREEWPVLQGSATKVEFPRQYFNC